ncbi:MAG TPA: GrpB family protein [Caulobacteraceae bacterium]|nr:GrpB family protein [Caulobacteraceae bacterium]
MSEIEIIDYQPRWAGEFQQIASVLRRTFGPLALAIHHIGSTSVPGLAAKDVIDLQVSVAALDPAAALEAAIEAVGYAMLPHLGGDHIPVGADPDPSLWRKRYASELAGGRRTHIHIRVLGLPNQRYPLLFRDYLRANPAAAGTYALIKRELAARHADDVDAYYAVKDPVCDLIFDAAELWAARAGWRLPESDA